jgi:Mrp family chromosome partitioning ATPase
VLPTASKKDLNYQDESVEQQASSAFAEGIRFARVSITFSSSSDSPAKSLLITSTAPNEGKSTISVHLAHSFADAGENVLLIDADLRKPSRYGVCSGSIGYEYGLTHFLNGDATPEAVFTKPRFKISILSILAT